MRTAAAFLLVVATAAAFTASPSRPAVAACALRSQPLAMSSTDSRGGLQEAWARYVLLRPGMTFDELKSTTLRQPTEQFTPTLDTSKRTPGTVRTVLFSSLLVFLAAVPALMQNPAVLVKLIELASLDRVGFTPMEVYQQTGSLIP